MILVSSLVEFVKRNRRGKAFLDYTDEQITFDIQSAIAKFACIVDCDENDNIFGIATGIPIWNKKIIHVKNILTIRRESLKNIFKRFLEVYPDWTLQGQRGERKLVEYKNINKLKAKIYGR